MDLTSESQHLNEKSSHPLQELLNNRITNGPAQQHLSLPLYILMFTEGCESVVISLLLPELQHEWEITNYQKSLMVTMIYIGVAIGSFGQSFADDYGRLKFIKWNAILQIIFGLLSCVSTSIYWFILFRFAYGIGIGIVLPISGTYISQITPSKDRGLLISKSRMYWSFGCLFTYALGWLLLENHHWRLLLLIICIPGVYSLYQIYANGKQSLRYLWARKRTEQVYELTTLMCKMNGKKQIPKQEIKHLIQIKENHSIQAEYKDLFKQKYLGMTLKMMIAWFSSSFVYYGLFLLMPSIISRNHSTSYDFKYLTLGVINVFQLLTFFLLLPLIDNPNFGRKKTMLYTFLLLVIFSLVLTVVGQQNTVGLLVALAIMKMAIAVNAVTIIPFTIQIYSTLIRSKGMGVCAVVGRFGSVCFGFVGMSALYWFDGDGLYLIFALLGLISAFAMFRMPYCTLGRAMDS